MERRLRAAQHPRERSEERFRREEQNKAGERERDIRTERVVQCVHTNTHTHTHTHTHPVPAPGPFFGFGRRPGRRREKREPLTHRAFFSQGVSSAPTALASWKGGAEGR